MRVRNAERPRERHPVTTRWLFLAAFIVTMASVGNAMVVEQMGDNVQSNRETAEQTQRTADKTQRQVDHVEQFVTKLETPSPEERAQNEAVSKAVATVPSIKAILCEQFPEATACQATRRQER